MIIEKVTEVIKFAEYNGAPYDTQITIQWLSPTWVNLKNLSGTFSKDKRDQINDYLAEQGVKKVNFTRFRNNKWITFELEVSYNDREVQDKT